MKLRHLVLGLLLFLLPYNLISQIDSAEFFDLKLKTERLQVVEKRDGLSDRIKNLRLAKTYFFFTEKGIYGADEYGVLLYDFKSSLEITEQLQLNRFIIRGYDHDFKKDCVIVVYDYYNRDKLKIFFVYKVRTFIFDCEKID